MISRLSDPAMKRIDHFTHLALGGVFVACPYYNNKRAQMRGGLRVLIGKGSPEEIEDEAMLFALREKVNLKALGEEKIKKFLVTHKLGVDCSALVTHVLECEVEKQTGTQLKKHISFPFIRSPFRKILARFRPIENTNVKTLAHEKNSVAVPLTDVRPGDIIAMVGAGLSGHVDHVLVVIETEYEEQLKKITYAHSFQWSTDGEFNHGVRTGTIMITHPNEPLTQQLWEEQGKTGSDNGTLARAKEAEALSIRRLRILLG